MLSQRAAVSPPARAREDSDVIVALIRTAFIIAFYMMRYVVRGYPVPLHMDVLLWLAATYNLFLLGLHLRGRILRRQRLFSLALDLLLVSAAVVTFRQGGQDLFALYYLVVIASAVWYRLVGSLSVAIIAIGLAIVSPCIILRAPCATAAVLYTTDAPLLLLIAVIAGYLMRARDAEHTANLELRQELRLARALQNSLLPDRVPEPEGYDIGLVFSPARQVGGDFYDLRLLDPDHLLVVLADMSGKSVYGLVHLSLVYSHLRAALQATRSPAEAARAVNAATYESLQPESYAALFIGILRLSDGVFTFVNCGHVPPVYAHAGQTQGGEELSSGCPVIGAMLHPVYEERQVKLEGGDRVVCFSDGISEARNKHREFFGETRVREIVAAAGDGPGQQLVEALVTAARRFAAAPGQDDVTVIALHRKAEDVASPEERAGGDS